MSNETVKELTDFLIKLEIEDFDLDSKEKVLYINTKEDFDRFYPELGGKPRVLASDSSMAGDLPYGAKHWAFFDYKKGWKIRGNIIRHKES